MEQKSQTFEEEIMEIIKWKEGEVMPHIKHNLRSYSPGHNYGEASSVDASLSGENYSLLDRCETAKGANEYRKKLEEKIHIYNRKNMVKCIELVVQQPEDCRTDQEAEAFFKGIHDCICSMLPMGEECVFVSEVHRDEMKLDSEGNRLSKDHLHMMFVPGVRTDKYEGYEYKLCADNLTKRKQLLQLHPNVQKYLDDHGIKGTVWRKGGSSRTAIALSTKQMKEITDKTGVKIDRTITAERLGEIIKENRDIKIFDKKLKEKIENIEAESVVKDEKISSLQSLLESTKYELDRALEKVAESKISLANDHQKEIDSLRNELSEAKKTISEKDLALEKAEGKAAKLSEELESKTKNFDDQKKELEQAKERIASLEKEQQKEHSTGWGKSEGWGKSTGWSGTVSKDEGLSPW